jgi:hypothetical protein
LKTAVIVLGAVATFTAAILLLRIEREGGRDELPPSASAVPAMTSTTAPGVRPLPIAGTLPAAIPPLTDTTGLLQSLTLDELLDQVEADSGGAFSVLEREQLATELRADPELRSSFAD